MINVAIISSLLVIGYFLFLFLLFIAAVFLLIKVIRDKKRDKENDKYQKIMK